MDEFTVVRPPRGLRVKGKLWVLNRARCGTRMASRCFGKLVAEVLTNAQFETVSIVPNTYHHAQRDIDTVVHGDDFVAVAEDGQLDHLKQVLENGDQASREGGDGFTWEADPRSMLSSSFFLFSLDLCDSVFVVICAKKRKVDREADQHAELEWWKGNVDPWRQRHRERRSRQ